MKDANVKPRRRRPPLDEDSDPDRYLDEEESPGSTLQEAEDEIGIASWIDPETGEPAEGQSPPHLEQD